MKGYNNESTYISNDRKTDIQLFFIVMFLIFTISMSLSVYDLWSNNNPNEWDPGVSMTGSVIAFLLLGIPAIFYLIQLVRMAILYMKGCEMWYQSYFSEYDFITLCVHPGIDLVKAFGAFLASALGSMLVNLVMQHESSRESALDGGIFTTVLVFVVAVVTPLSLKGMQYVRKKQLEKLETYRQVGGRE